LTKVKNKAAPKMSFLKHRDELFENIVHQLLPLNNSSLFISHGSLVMCLNSWLMVAENKCARYINQTFPLHLTTLSSLKSSASFWLPE